MAKGVTEGGGSAEVGKDVAEDQRRKNIVNVEEEEIGREMEFLGNFERNRVFFSR